MAGNFSGASREGELDWDNLSNPVPMDLIDPEFPAHAVPAELPGSRSEIMPRAESEAFAAEHEAAPSSSALPASVPNAAPSSAPSAAPDATRDATLYLPAQPAPEEPPAAGAGTIQMPARGVPSPTGSGSTTFGAWPQDQAEIQDEFSRIRAKMEAETEADKKAKLEADKEEATQRERLDQWMANARNRLLKADADLTGPSARIRIRKEHSPSLYRLAEMQKTIWVEGQSTQVDAQTSSFRSMDREESAKPPLDPMATISVPTEQFLTLDAPAQPTMREQALARQAAQQAAQLEAVKQAATRQPAVPQTSARQIQDAAPPRPVENALTAHTATPASPRDAQPPRTPPPSQGEFAYQPMTREQALTRKVAQLRKVAEGGDNTLAIGPGESPPVRSALHFAIAAVVIVAIAVLGVGLFAATQAGLFDGLENRIPFLRPDVPAKPDGVRPAPRPVPAAAAPAQAPATTSVAQAPAADVAPGNQPLAPSRAPAGQAKPQAAIRSSNPAATVGPAAPFREPALRASAHPAKTAKTAKPAPKASARPEAARRAAPKTAAAAPTAPAVEPDDGEIPAYAKPRAKAANLGEIILRASVQAAANIDKDNLHEMYNRYALGFPGLSGQVEIGLMVDPGGRILEGSVVNSTTGVEAFDQELLRKVLDWRLRAFPESRPKFIVVPFLFPLQGR